MERFVAYKKGSSGTWAVYDKDKGCFVLQSVSPNAKYNEDFAKAAAYAMNAIKNVFK